MNVFNGGSDPGLAWEELERRVETCAACELHACRKKTVFGQGNRTSPLVFIGEGPGAEEDEQGIAFVGRAGKLLSSILQSVGIDRDDVFITNVVKCRPPENRTPLAKEMMACNEFLEAQLALLRPRIVVCLAFKDLRGHLVASRQVVPLARDTALPHVSPELPSSQRLKEEGKPQGPDLAGYKRA